MCVVEQTETVSEANERSANAGRKSTGALVERKICEVFTTGTLIHEDMLGNSGASHYLCSLSPGSGERVGVVLVDCATGRFQVGVVDSYATLKTVLFTFQPKEVLFDPKIVPGNLAKLLNSFKEAHGGTASLTRWSQWESPVSVPDMGVEVGGLSRSTKEV